MPTNIFSTYSTGENRITASILAVLRSLSIQRTERLLGALLQSTEFELIRFENQAPIGGESIPDARIRSNCCILIETKIVLNSLNQRQLKDHLKGFDGIETAKCVLLALTPDPQRPTVIDNLNDARIAWSSFFDLDQAINEMLADPKEVVSEREAFLLRELQEMLQNEGLLLAEEEVVVVAARQAWPEYEDKYGAYVCQADRHFQQVSHFAFYADKRIQRQVPRIEESHEHVVFTRGKNDGRLGELVNRMLADGVREPGVAYKVLLLSAPDSSNTIKLKQPIDNDLKAETGRPIAFTQGQRYVSLKQLQNAKTTSDLVDRPDKRGSSVGP
jgi:hypothetical protein